MESSWVNVVGSAPAPHEFTTTGGRGSPVNVDSSTLTAYIYDGAVLPLGSAGRAATRAELAALPGALNVATLYENRRQGLFYYDTTDYSAHVSGGFVYGDTRQGIFVLPTADLTGASGCWVRFSGVDLAISTDWFGPDGINDTPAIAATHALANTLGRRHVVWASDLNCTTALDVSQNNLTINADGITLSHSLTTLAAAFRVSGASVTVNGPYIHLTDTTTNLAYIDVTGPDCHFNRLRYQRDATSAIPMYLHGAGASGFEWRGGEMNAYGGLNSIDASHVLLDGVFFHQPDGGATDDATSIKSITAEVVDWRVVNCHFRNKSEFVSIGSEIGVLGGSDSTYSRGVYDVTVDNCFGENCTCVLYIKPGLQYDYRDGTVQNITVAHCSLRDLTGVFARNLVFITSSRGARVRDVYVNDCTGRYRCPDRSGSGNAGILLLSTSFPGGTATAEVDGLFVDGMSITDPFGGLGNGAAGTSGYPIDQFIAIDGSTGGGGALTIFKRIEITNFRGNGCARAGMSVTSASAVTGPIILDKPTFTNFSAAELGSSDRAAIVNSWPIEIHGLNSTKAPTANANTRLVMGDSQPDKTIVIADKVSTPVAFPTVGALNTGSGVIFQAPANCWISRIDIIATTGTPQSDTNYTTISIGNRGTTGTLIAATTKVTGGINITANTPCSLNGATQFTGADSYLPKGSVLTYSKADTGPAGAALTNFAFVVHYVICGNA